MTERCRLCGRFAVRLQDGYCSPRCAELAGTYRSPAHAPAALAAPTSPCVATLLVSGPLPAGCAPIASAGERHVLRLGADSWDDLDAAIEAVDGASAEEAVEIFTLQQFAGGGLASAIPTRRGTT